MECSIMDDILKIAELVFNIIQFIYSLKESNSATTNIMNDNRTVVLGDQINIHINNTTAHEQKKSNLFVLYTFILWIISIILNIYYYNLFSVIIFCSSIIYTIFSYHIINKYHITGFVRSVLCYQGILYTAFSLSTYRIPSHLAEIQDRFPIPTNFSDGLSYVIQWLSDASSVLFEIMVTNLSQNKGAFLFVTLMFIIFRAIGPWVILKDGWKLYNKKGCEIMISQIKEHKNSYIKYLVCITIITLLIFGYDKVPFFMDIIDYLSA